MSFALANRLCTKTLLSTQLIEIFNEVLLAKDSEQLRNNIRRDLVGGTPERSFLWLVRPSVAVIQRLSRDSSAQDSTLFVGKRTKVVREHATVEDSEALGVDVHLQNLAEGF